MSKKRSQRVEPVDTELLDLGDPRQRMLHRVAGSSKGMISTAHYCATEVGIWILEQGGNAFDAAAGAAFALGVCEPAASGLGGQTMMIAYQAETKRKFAVDGSSRVPNRATPHSLSKEDRRRGYKACTVPSTPATLGYVVERYGRLPLKTILKPVIALAENGYQISSLQHALTKRERKHLRNGTAGDLFLISGKKVPPVGYLFRQPKLASTLRKMARKGYEEFYLGSIAKQIHKDMIQNGGLIRKEDLAQIPLPMERRPLSGKFGPLRFFTMPPPGAGRTLVEMLNILKCFKPKDYDPDTAKGALLLADVIRRAFLDRQDRPYDPHYFPQVDGPRTLKPDYAKLVAKQLRKRIKTSGETTHLSVMDKDGNAVGLTQSIERVFGSCCASPDLGFIYNNYMGAFEYEDISHPYFMRPNAVPWASVSPTIIFRGRAPWMVLGSPGSERIAPSVMQVLVRLLKGQAPFEAVAAPRLHCSLNGKVSLEAARMSDDIPKLLQKRGFEIDIRDPYSFYLGCVQLVSREKKRFVGVADLRRDGAAGGPEK